MAEARESGLPRLRGFRGATAARVRAMPRPSVRAGLLCAVLAVLALPAPADAALRTFTLRSGPVSMAAYNVAFPKLAVPAPGVDGYVVGMSARLVDRRGRHVTIRDVMLHHVVFHQLRARRSTLACTGRGKEAFYGTGEENQRLRLPDGYGYRIGRHSRWRMNAMLMSHSLRALDVHVQYRVTVATGVRLQEVHPFWVRANGCGATTSYPVNGGGAPGSTDTRAYAWKVPFDGRIVAAGGHLHGGAKDLWLSQPRCGDRRLLDTAPRYGMPDSLYYRVRPTLHEPGPVETRYFLSRAGLPVRRGEVLHLTGTYDAEHPHPRVMAIMHLYLVKDPSAAAACRPLPADARELTRYQRVRTEPPVVTVPLNRLDDKGHSAPILDPPWPATPMGAGGTVVAKGLRFDPPHVQLGAGDTLTWRFADPIPHNVIYANGPRLIGTPTLKGGAERTVTFAVPGRYELFCYLHPMTMHEVVDVVTPAQ